jgi:23S rRNA G2069 N7-methylase RlmK/C1962 C5-methylase RlmI
MFKAEDERQWQNAEARLREALQDFARATAGSYRNRLFADDALEGLRLIDLVAEAFDVVVMNPPFGSLSHGVKDGLGKAFQKSKNDLLAIFVERGIELLRRRGKLGAITSRTCFFLSSFQKWREEVLLSVAPPALVADFGLGVMDDAMVEAAAYILDKLG